MSVPAHIDEWYYYHMILRKDCLTCKCAQYYQGNVIGCRGYSGVVHKPLCEIKGSTVYIKGNEEKIYDNVEELISDLHKLREGIKVK